MLRIRGRAAAAQSGVIRSSWNRTSEPLQMSTVGTHGRKEKTEHVHGEETEPRRIEMRHPGRSVHASVRAARRGAACPAERGVRANERSKRYRKSSTFEARTVGMEISKQSPTQVQEGPNNHLNRKQGESSHG
jgi:hypothetical protein